MNAHERALTWRVRRVLRSGNDAAIDALYLRLRDGQGPTVADRVWNAALEEEGL
jgi:hypothetical protein